MTWQQSCNSGRVYLMIFGILIVCYFLSAVALRYIGGKNTRGPAKNIGDYIVFCLVWFGMTAFFYAVLGG